VLNYCYIWECGTGFMSVKPVYSELNVVDDKLPVGGLLWNGRVST